jgi:hypothetical protein
MTARVFAYVHGHPRLALAAALLVVIFNDDSCGKGHWR